MVDAGHRRGKYTLGEQNFGRAIRSNSNQWVRSDLASTKTSMRHSVRSRESSYDQIDRRGLPYEHNRRLRKLAVVKAIGVIGKIACDLGISRA